VRQRTSSCSWSVIRVRPDGSIRSHRWNSFATLEYPASLAAYSAGSRSTPSGAHRYVGRPALSERCIQRGELAEGGHRIPGRTAGTRSAWPRSGRSSASYRHASPRIRSSRPSAIGQMGRSGPELALRGTQLRGDREPLERGVDRNVLRELRGHVIDRRARDTPPDERSRASRSVAILPPVPRYSAV